MYFYKCNENWNLSVPFNFYLTKVQYKDCFHHSTYYDWLEANLKVDPGDSGTFIHSCWIQDVQERRWTVHRLLFMRHLTFLTGAIYEVIFWFYHIFFLVSENTSASPFSRILKPSAVLLCHIFHRVADSSRSPRRETVSGQIRTSMGHLLSTHPLQDLPLYILNGGCHTVSLWPHKSSSNLKFHWTNSDSEQ